jgi:sterol desaturase/sphingolipid hydroxylase (fatty acid hydroxylase superfamily)
MVQGRIGYFSDMAASPLLASGLCVYAFHSFTRVALIEWSFVTAFGGLLWTLIEYLVHRMVYHRVAFLTKYHEGHHADPRAYVGAPPLFGTSLVFLISFIPLLTVDMVLADAISVGMLLGYTAYMLVHHGCHHWTPTRGSYLYRARVRHAAHHYRSKEANFGVTTSLWDRAFATHLQSACDWAGRN